MANVLQICGNAEFDRLQVMADELDLILSEIGYDGKARDPEYIRDKQECMRKEYGALFDALNEGIKALPELTESDVLKGIGLILDAYDGLRGLLFLHDNGQEGQPSEEDFLAIEEEAKDLLYENLLFPYGMLKEVA